MTHTTSTTVPEQQRMSTVDKLFGLAYVVQLEPTVFSFAGALAPDYQGAYWDFYTLSNGGFYMAPRLDETFAIECDNGFEGKLSADALGIAACLYSYSHLSMEAKGPFAQTCAEHFHLLREFALGHAEAGALMQAIDSCMVAVAGWEGVADFATLGFSAAAADRSGGGSGGKNSEKAHTGTLTFSIVLGQVPETATPSSHYPWQHWQVWRFATPSPPPPLAS